MIPRDYINTKTSTVYAEFLHPENLLFDPLTDVCYGGNALNDPSGGRNTKIWEAYYEGGKIKVKPQNDSTPVFELSAPGATFISLAFDSNMGVVICWQSNATSNIYYFDVVDNVFVTKTVSNTTSCKISIDDYRDFNLANSDVIFGYTKNGSLYYRVQRERYDEEHYVGETTGTLIRLGMTKANRFQFECCPFGATAAPPPTTTSPPVTTVAPTTTSSPVTTTAAPPPTTTVAPPPTTTAAPPPTTTINSVPVNITTAQVTLSSSTIAVFGSAILTLTINNVNIGSSYDVKLYTDMSAGVDLTPYPYATNTVHVATTNPMIIEVELNNLDYTNHPQENLSLLFVNNFGRTILFQTRVTEVSRQTNYKQSALTPVVYDNVVNNRTFDVTINNLPTTISTEWGNRSIIIKRVDGGSITDLIGNSVFPNQNTSFVARALIGSSQFILPTFGVYNGDPYQAFALYGSTQGSSINPKITPTDFPNITDFTFT